MSPAYDEIRPDHAAWLAEQPVFFVATAPSGPGGHVNVSPKGYDTFRVLGPRRVAFLDLTGSGAETVAHVRQNGRITFMFCSFGAKPRVLRLQGTGTVVVPGDDGFAEAAALFPEQLGTRAVITADLDRVATSCGYGVPVSAGFTRREMLDEWADRKGPEGLANYHAEKNARSIDGLPALAADGAGAPPAP
jgi:hypothetical protein